MQTFLKCKDTLKHLSENPKTTEIVYSACLEIYKSYSDKIKDIGHEFTFSMEGYLTMRKGQPLLPEINKIIEEIRSAGLVQKWISEMSKTHFYVREESTELTLEHVEGALFMLGCGYMLSLIIFCSEIIRGRIYSICSKKFGSGEQDIWH